MTTTVDEMANLYTAGWSLRRIAEHVGVSRQTVWQRLHDAGVQMRPRVRSGPSSNFYRGTRSHPAAHTAVARAVARGHLTRPTECEVCGQVAPARGPQALHAHHRNYKEPLSVVWVCRRCHHALHLDGPSIPADEVEVFELSLTIASADSASNT